MLKETNKQSNKQTNKKPSKVMTLYPGQVQGLLPQGSKCALDPVDFTIQLPVTSRNFGQEQASSLGPVSGLSRSKRPIPISTTAPPIQSPLPVIPHQKVGAGHW